MNVVHRAKVLTTGVALSLLWGCAGSSSVPASAPAPQAQVSAGRATGTVNLFIPSPSGAHSSTRMPQYVSPFSKSLQISAGPATSVYGAALALVPVGAGAPGCTAVSGGFNCSVQFGAPAGLLNMGFTLYDAFPITATTNPLSNSPTLQFTLAADQNTAITATLNGIAGAVTITPSSVLNFKSGVASTQQITVVGLDLDNGVITGSKYDLPIVITSSNPAITVSPSSLAGPANTNVSVSYNGATGLSSPQMLTFTEIPSFATSFYNYLFQQINVNIQ